MEYPFFARLRKTSTASLQEIFEAKTLSFISLMITPSRRERACDQHTKSYQILRERLADALGSATPRPPRIQKTRRNAAGRTQRCGQQRGHFAGGGTPPPAIFPFPRPRPRPLSALPHPAPSTPGAWTLTRETALSPPVPPTKAPHVCARRS